MSVQQIYSRGIYHGLPVFPDDLQGLTAVITGANGISGQHMLRVLAQAPKRWQKIFCLSRRPPVIPGGLPSNAVHIPLDFLEEPADIARTLKEHEVKADYVFFYSYIQVEPKEGQGLWTNAEEMAKVNTVLLSNLLEALPLASIKPRRIMLQTGAKNYGLHLGPTLVPQEESDPRVLIEPNFYYAQEDYLWMYCEKRSIGWNVVRPSFILGAVPDAAMNVCYPLAIYASVCKRLREPLRYPADLASWETVQDQSSAMLNGYLEEWAVLTDAAENQAFNACDNSAFTWGKFWPKLAGWYGINYRKPDLDDAQYREVRMASEQTPRGFGPQAVVRTTFTFAEWAKRAEVRKAWSELAEMYGLTRKSLDDAGHLFSFTDAAVSNAIHINFSMDKAHKLGFFGTVDSSECIMEVLKGFADLKMVPPVPVASRRT